MGSSLVSFPAVQRLRDSGGCAAEGLVDGLLRRIGEFGALHVRHSRSRPPVVCSALFRPITPNWFCPIATCSLRCRAWHISFSSSVEVVGVMNVEPGSGLGHPKRDAQGYIVLATTDIEHLNSQVNYRYQDCVLINMGSGNKSRRPGPAFPNSVM